MTETNKWPGGRGRITVEGTFLSGGGVSTCAAMTFIAHLPDGGTEKMGEVCKFHAPGTHDIALPPGEYSFDLSGPHGMPWKLSARFDPIKRARKEKRPTITDRVEALETRIGNRGLSS